MMPWQLISRYNCAFLTCMKNVCRIFVKKLQKKKPLDTSSLKWEYDIKMDLGEGVCVLWIELIWLRIGSNCRLL
jgi:hypothetical protein